MPPRAGTLLALLLTADEHQSLRILRSLMSAAVYVMSSLVILYGVWKRTIATQEGLTLVVIMLGTSAFFYAVLRTGWNRRFSDPYLTLPQVLVGVTVAAGAYGITNEAHGGTLVPLTLALVYGVVNMRRRQAFIASVYALLCIGPVMLYKGVTDPLVYHPHIQGAYFVMVLAVFPTLAGVAATLSRARHSIKTRRAQLATAIKRFAETGEVPDSQSTGDTHELDELWRQFVELARQRQELEERRSAMLAAISHDLRSPLGRIRMAAQLLPKAEGVEVRREAIVRNVKVANRLLTAFIDMARADHERIADRVDLRALVQEVALSAPEARIHELPAKPQWLAPASAVALERALRNLIDNARAYGAPPVEMGLRCGAASVLWVRDHGPGLDPLKHEDMLQPFTRGESNRLTPGTGLGLAIVHRTIVRHGGKIVMSDAAPGLRVELHLPPCQAGA
jgi:signal transduction histidine kinase